MSEFERLAERVARFAYDRFPARSAVEAARKVRKEAAELATHPFDIIEAADVLITLLSWCHASDWSASDLLEHTSYKMDVNESRKWAKQEDGTYQHVE